MLQIRKNVFETNSSSTHSICISKKPIDVPTGKMVYFSFGSYGWENDTVNDTASYLYTGIMDNNNRDENLKKLKKMLDEMGVFYEFEVPVFDNYGYFDGGYVDHADRLNPFIIAVLSDKDLLARYLFGDSFIETGNDNQDAYPSGCNICDAEVYDDDTHTYVKNPYYDPEHYDYFYKGN